VQAALGQCQQAARLLQSSNGQADLYDLCWLDNDKPRASHTAACGFVMRAWICSNVTMCFSA
jgi:hypothetical protein